MQKCYFPWSYRLFSEVFRCNLCSAVGKNNFPVPVIESHISTIISTMSPSTFVLQFGTLANLLFLLFLLGNACFSSLHAQHSSST